MRRRTKQLLGGVALALGAAGAVLLKKRRPRRRRDDDTRRAQSVWARPGMMVTFRAELMPGRPASERTFRIAELLPSGRVTLDNVSGEHAEKEFEPLR